MKKTFTLAMAACLGMYANAQDASSWENGQDVTKEIQWKAYDAADEDPANPAWQGFSYGAAGEWEFRPAGVAQGDLQTDDANNNNYFMCWGVYNLPPLDVYQEFSMPAGVYEMSVQGCYRYGQDDATLKMWVNGEKNEYCFVYAKVGEDNYQTPLLYKFDARATEALGASFSNNNWGNEKEYTYTKDGELRKVWSPQSHCAADWFIELGYFTGNTVTFVVPEDGMTVRVGINKPSQIAQDQVWWNHWRMIYKSAYNDEAKVMVAKMEVDALIKSLRDTQEKYANVYPGLAALMGDDIMEMEDASSNAETLEEVNKIIETLKTYEEKHKGLIEKAAVLEKTYDICNGMFQVTNYPGKADLEAVMSKSKALLYSDELDDNTTTQTYVDAANELIKARIDYLNSQEFNPVDGSKDFTHALAFPWWVNQENTGVHDADGFHYPQNVVDALNSCDDGADGNLETGMGKQSGTEVTFEAVSSKAGWTNKADAENTWVYVDNWNGWHGGMSAFIQKLKGVAGLNTDWSTGVGTGPGGMEVYQNLSNLPDGYYTLEGLVWHNSNEEGSPNWAGDLNYMFFEDGEGNALAKEYQVIESQGYWSGWAVDQYTTLKTDFVELKGGKARVGYFNKCWSLNSIMELKYYGTEINYTGIIQQKIADNTPQDGELWPGDQKTYDAILAKIVYPIAGADAYAEAIAIVNEAIAFKSKAAAGAANYQNVLNKYEEMINSYEEDCTQTEILAVAQIAALNLGNGENDSYTDGAAAGEICNAYESYLATYNKAFAYTGNIDKAKLESTAKEQAADLTVNYSNVATLAAYESAIATILNTAIFADLGSDKASEATPMNITEALIVNPSLAEGPKTGWTLAGADVNPGVNTYGRQLAECWNQQPFEISQTFMSLPGGTYELRVRACYRAGGTVDQNMVNATTDGSFAYNAVLFANGNEVNIKSVCDTGWTDPSFTEWYDGKSAADDYVTQFGFMKDWDGTLYISPEEFNALDFGGDEDLKFAAELKSIDMENPAYPFDTKVGDMFYPCSMAGFQQRLAKSPDAYCNMVQVMVEDGGSLKIGIRKNEAIGSDWVIYDDFELYYLGKEASSGIADVNAGSEKKTIYNVAGQKMNTLQKGINIVNGKKIFVK